jgi:hypothetical protein
MVKLLIDHQGIICGVAFDRSSLRRIGSYASLVAPRRLASNTLLVIRISASLGDFLFRAQRRMWILDRAVSKCPGLP